MGPRRYGERDRSSTWRTGLTPGWRPRLSWPLFFLVQPLRWTEARRSRARDSIRDRTMIGHAPPDAIVPHVLQLVRSPADRGVAWATVRYISPNYFPRRRGFGASGASSTRGTRTPASTVTTERLATKLSQYDGRRNTLRKVHSSWSVFFDYCARLRGIYATNPMRDVPRPKHEKNPIQFCEQDEVERIVDWQPTAERRALFALLYGTALRYRSRWVSLARTLTRQHGRFARRNEDFNSRPNCSRGRLGVADAVGSRAADAPGNAPISWDWDRWTASDWHRHTVGEGTKDTHGRVIHEGLKLRQRLPMKNARHHWAVRRLRSGSPIHVVQRQLGHESAKLALDVSGAFVPTGAHRDRAEKNATEYEERRKAAKWASYCQGAFHCTKPRTRSRTHRAKTKRRVGCVTR